MEVNLHLTLNHSVEVNFSAPLYHPRLEDGKQGRFTLTLPQTETADMLSNEMACLVEKPGCRKRKARILSIDRTQPWLKIHCEWCSAGHGKNVY